jgi:hypothetical protein
MLRRIRIVHGVEAMHQSFSTRRSAARQAIGPSDASPLPEFGRRRILQNLGQ